MNNDENYKNGFDTISDMAVQGLLKGYVEYYANGIIVHRWVNDIPEFIDTGQALVPSSMYGSMTLWKWTTTGWIATKR